MKVTISEAVVLAAVGTPDVLHLHQLLLFACQGRHVLVFDTQVASSACLDTIAASARQLYSNALAQSVRTAAGLPADVATICVVNTTSPRWEDPVAVLPLDRAVATLSEPLGIFVENAENDWAFLYGMMRQSERDRMCRAVQSGWAKPLHGGGSNLKSEIPRRLASPEQGLRTFVMFDSDRRHPDELDATWAPVAPEACQGYDVQQLIRPQLQHRHWMLRRRFIESYMPESEIGKIVRDRPDAIRAFFQMNQNARWYFNMKKGFKDDEAVENRHRCRDLYAGVSAADLTVLHNGFGRKLADQYQQTATYEFNWDAEARQEASDALSHLMRLL